MKKNNTRILLQPWKKCEKHFVAIVEGKGIIDGSTEEITSFLKAIGYLDDSAKLSPKGHDYYQKKYIENDEKAATFILADSLKVSRPVILICSTLWGVPNITGDNIHRLLALNGLIPTNAKSKDLGSFLMLLNQCNILRYSKKTGKIVIVYNPRTATPEKRKTTAVTPSTPYSNIKGLWECIRKCQDFVYWFDKHFSTKGLEPLSDELDGNVVKGVRILLGNNANIRYEKLRRDFKRFSDQMKNRGIKAECRVLCNSDLLGKIHARWILGKNICFNVPPINSIYKGQFDDFKETRNIPPFAEWWKQALDIIDDWGQIEPTLRKKTKSGQFTALQT